MSAASRVAVVAGAGGGIGLCVVAALRARGLRVVAGDIDEAALSRVSAIGAPADEVVPVRLDVTDPRSVAAIAARAIEGLGRVDVLVNAAGVFHRGPATRIDEDAMRRVLSVNLEGALRLGAVFGAIFAERGGGRIVHVASIAGISGAAMASIYAASKAGVIAAARSAARELGPRGVRVNVVAPGFCDTPMLAPDRALVERFTVPGIPARRVGRPEEVAEAACFLATSETDYMNGSVLTIDGGLLVG